LRVRLHPSADRTELLVGRIELHLFAGGYAGVVLQEDGSANVCMAVRKSLLARCGGKPTELLGQLAAAYPSFAKRFAGEETADVETIGAVPYGWAASTTDPGVFRLGDQAVVIPSLVGEGISIALASGVLAARTWLTHGAAGAEQFQAKMTVATAAPLRAARLARILAESPLGARAGLALAARAPAVLYWLIEASRIAPDAPLAQPVPAP
jgi:flavin-dependent dehydrogenase